ncbi:hypothetical protein N825_33215 [Skermanella stibiiresistens SB22]|uniref:VacJ family lipoprotein n=1 Tax=Skermanella stibiiresistens SB22 TaxID=1385369 RepID=W9H7Q2_9PROT|nr:VacJ family lipoprotein [Skermanella stibiiresistens]EWY40791.1 hypothetical protein N825_33215 [Skermanella stibiiresistens SB22]
MRQLCKQGARAIVAAAFLLVAGMAESQAGRFLDDRDFEEAMALGRMSAGDRDWTSPSSSGTPTPATLTVMDDQSAADETIGDPAEEVNRFAHLFNQQVRRLVLEPVSEAYVEATSAPVRQGVSNVFSNLREPVWLAGHVLKGDWGAAETTAARFAINTTVGLGGVYDEAARHGMEARKATIDEVFCHYGVGPGPYVVLPILGPSSARDLTGRVLTIMAQYAVLGAYLIPYRIADVTMQYIAVRNDLRSLDQQALDSYAAERSVFAQLQSLSCGERLTVESRLFAQ